VNTNSENLLNISLSKWLKFNIQLWDKKCFLSKRLRCSNKLSSIVRQHIVGILTLLLLDTSSCISRKCCGAHPMFFAIYVFFSWTYVSIFNIELNLNFNNDPCLDLQNDVQFAKIKIVSLGKDLQTASYLFWFFLNIQYASLLRCWQA
jgi:hypothetical protein